MVEENTTCLFRQNNKMLTKLLCAVVILASGIIIGSGVTIQMIKHRVIWVDKIHMDTNDITNKIAEKYTLDAQQIEGVRGIMNRAFEHKKSNDEWMDKQRDDYAQVIITEMNSVMTPEQYAKWKKDFLEMRETFKKRK
ncbi:MAG: hypothetical protein LLF92_09915 [Planctomycetaceae bacterium]|nr:hypothetical protein [Planctomycetaceae bacterium]